jgi:hypothetical protein
MCCGIAWRDFLMSAGLSNGSKGLRLLIAVLGTVVPLAPGLASGCGSSSSPVAPAPTTQIPADATIPLVMVVTAGGGAPTSSSSSSSGANQNPLGDLPVPDSGSSSGGTSSSGGGSGDLSDDGSTDSGSDDSGDGSSGPPQNVCTNYTVPVLGVIPCDLRTSIGCVSLMGQVRCLKRSMQCDPKMEASIHCLQSCECPVGEVCCGVANTILGVVTSECQSIPDGGLCNPHPQTNTQSSEQLCGTDAECTAGQGCIKQTCELGVTLEICGLQSQDPFDCMPAQ